MVCDCLSANSLEEALGKVLSADDIVKEVNTTPHPQTGGREATQLEALLRWWRNVTEGDNYVCREGTGRDTEVVEPAHKLTQKTFEQIIAR